MLVKRIWMDSVDGQPPDPVAGDVDVMVEMENGELWTAHFVTIPYLQQQLTMSAAVTGSELNSHVALETPHVIVQQVSQEHIEDIVYELIGAGTFESVFDLVIDVPTEGPALASE